MKNKFSQFKSSFFWLSPTKKCHVQQQTPFNFLRTLWPPLVRSNYRMYEWEFLFYPVEFARKVAYEKNSKKHKLRKKSEHFLQTAALREKALTKSTMGKNCDAFLSFLFEALHVCSMCEEHKVKENEWKIVLYQRHTSNSTSGSAENLFSYGKVNEIHSSIRARLCAKYHLYHLCCCCSRYCLYIYVFMLMIFDASTIFVRKIFIKMYITIKVSLNFAKDVEKKNMYPSKRFLELFVVGMWDKCKHKTWESPAWAILRLLFLLLENFAISRKCTDK